MQVLVEDLLLLPGSSKTWLKPYMVLELRYPCLFAYAMSKSVLAIVNVCMT